MREARTFPRAYLYTGKVDFRKWLKGLVTLIELEWQKDLTEDALFIFVSRNRRVIKTVYWDLTGFALWTKVLEQASFPLPKSHSAEWVLSAQELELFLQGVDIFRSKPHEILQIKRFN